MSSTSGSGRRSPVTGRARRTVAWRRRWAVERCWTPRGPVPRSRAARLDVAAAAPDRCCACWRGEAKAGNANHGVCSAVPADRREGWLTNASASGARYHEKRTTSAATASPRATRPRPSGMRMPFDGVVDRCWKCNERAVRAWAQSEVERLRLRAQSRARRRALNAKNSGEPPKRVQEPRPGVGPLTSVEPFG